MIDKKFTYAIVGASTNHKKYGYTVLKDLLDAGYKAIPVNPNEQIILGQIVYPSLSSITQPIDVVVFVVPPLVTQKILEEVKILGIKNVWMQPGSENNESIKICNENGINCIYNACIMIQKNNSSEK